MSTPLTNLPTCVAAEAMALNNRGVHLFTDGTYDQAISIFSMSLSMVNQRFNDLDREHSSSPTASTDATPVCFFQHVQESQCSSSIASGPFIFKRPIFILPSHTTIYRVSKAYLRKLLFIQIFNLALSYHMSALSLLRDDDDDDDESDASKSELNLRKARDLYAAAANMSSTQDMHLTLLEEMAFVNNLGQVHAALNDTELSIKWFQHLASALMLSNDGDEDEDEDEDDDMEEDDDDVEQLDDFMSSVMQGILGHHASMPAPAA